MLLPFKIMDLKPGDYFGERAILRDTGMETQCLPQNYLVHCDDLYGIVGLWDSGQSINRP